MHHGLRGCLVLIQKLFNAALPNLSFRFKFKHQSSIYIFTLLDTLHLNEQAMHQIHSRCEEVTLVQ